jgi:hypothetical protein
MVRPFLAAGIAVALMASPAVAQQSPSPGDQPAAGQIDTTLVGLPVYSSDGHKLGQVAEVGMSGGQPAVRAEMKDLPDVGSADVIIGADVFQKKADRIEISMTAAEVTNTISKQREERKQQ